MYRLYPKLKWVWAGLIGGLVVVPLVGDCVRGLIIDTGCTPWKPALAFVNDYYPWIVLFLFALGGLTWISRQNYLRHHASGAFDLLKPANELHPRDLRFRVVEPGEETELEEHPALNLRPFYESKEVDTYVDRLAVSYEERAVPETYYDEDDLVDSLHKGQGFVLIGRPEDGKPRTARHALSTRS